jgi:hypothetical protein
LFACSVFFLPFHPAAAQTVADGTACLVSVYNSPEAAPLRPHIPLNPINATSAQLSDRSYPTLSAALNIPHQIVRLYDADHPLPTDIIALVVGKRRH